VEKTSRYGYRVLLVVSVVALAMILQDEELAQQRAR